MREIRGAYPTTYARGPGIRPSTEGRRAGKRHTRLGANCEMLGSGPESRTPKANQQLWGSDPRAITPTVWVLQLFCEKPVEAKLVMTHDTEKVKSVLLEKSEGIYTFTQGRVSNV